MDKNDSYQNSPTTVPSSWHIQNCQRVSCIQHCWTIKWNQWLQSLWKLDVLGEPKWKLPYCNYRHSGWKEGFYQGKWLNTSGGLLKEGLSGAGYSQHLITRLWSQAQMVGCLHQTGSEISNTEAQKSASKREENEQLGVSKTRPHLLDLCTQHIHQAPTQFPAPY